MYSMEHKRFVLDGAEPWFRDGVGSESMLGRSLCVHLGTLCHCGRRWTLTPTSGPSGCVCVCVWNMVMASSSHGWSPLVFTVVSVLSDPSAILPPLRGRHHTFDSTKGLFGLMGEVGPWVRESRDSWRYMLSW